MLEVKSTIQILSPRDNNPRRQVINKANYAQIAETWEAGRPLYDRNLALCLDVISNRVGSRKPIMMLDLGCGTGRFAVPFAYRLGYSVTAIDNSKEMIEKAKQKDSESRVNWLERDVTNMEFGKNSYDIIFMSHLLHHLDNPYNLIRQCYKIMKPQGILFNRYGALEHVSVDPEHKFFPEALKIDELRTQTIKQIETWMREAGFAGVQTETSLQASYNSGEDRLSRVRLKSTSVLTLISQQSFEEGLKQFEKYVLAHTDDPWLINDKMTITSGFKPE